MSSKEGHPMKTRVLNFRLEPETASLINAWLAKNPGFTASQLGNLALRAFVTKPFVLEPVAAEVAPEKDYFAALDTVLDEHSDAMERLK
jgi:hypothetical protein